MVNPNPRKKLKRSQQNPININPPQNIGISPSREFEDKTRRIVQEEAARQLQKFIVQNPPEQNSFIAHLSDDLTTATTPDGYQYNAIVVGEQPDEYAPFFKIDGSRGVAYSPDINRVFIDSSAKPGYLLEFDGSRISVRKLGESKGYVLPVSIPQGVLDAGQFEAKFSANCKNILVGYWYSNQNSPYETRAVVNVFQNFTLRYENGNPDFTYKSTLFKNVDLDALS